MEINIIKAYTTGTDLNHDVFIGYVNIMMDGDIYIGPGAPNYDVDITDDMPETIIVSSPERGDYEVSVEDLNFVEAKRYVRNR